MVGSNSSAVSTGILKHSASLPLGEQTIFHANACGHAAWVILLLVFFIFIAVIHEQVDAAL